MKRTTGSAVRFISGTLMAVLIAVLGTGCAGKRVDHDVLSTVRKVGILSITIDKLGKQPSDDEVMQSTVDYAARMYAEALSNRPEWKLVPLTYKEAAFRDFLKPPVVPQKPQASTFMERIQQINESIEANFNVERFIRDDSAKYLVAADMPLIPYGFLERMIGKKPPVQPAKPKNMNDLKLDLTRKIGDLAAKLNLDGLLVIYLRTGIYSSGMGDVNVFWNDRALDTVRMEPTLVLVSREGRTAVDLGYPVIGHGSTKNASMPIYKVEGHRGAGISIGGKSKQPDEAKFPIDLKDPGGKVQRDLYALTDLALRDFLKRLDKELTQKK